MTGRLPDASAYDAGMKMAGVIYLHDITAKRWQGPIARNFEVFEKMCGQAASRNVLVTTMWNHVARSLGEGREQELKHEFWKDMIKNGAAIHRGNLVRMAAQDTVDYLLVKEVRYPLKFQKELGENNKTLQDTEAMRHVRALQQLLRTRSEFIEMARPTPSQGILENHIQFNSNLEGIVGQTQLDIAQRIMRIFRYGNVSTNSTKTHEEDVGAKRTSPLGSKASVLTISKVGLEKQGSEPVAARMSYIQENSYLYRALLETRGSDAQALPNILQWVMYDADLAGDLTRRRQLIVATQRLSIKSGLYPSCYELKGVVQDKDSLDPVAGGGFADIYKGSFGGQVQFSKEIMLWGQLSHMNVLPIYGLYRFKKRLCVVAPWIHNGDITAYLKQNPAVDRRSQGIPFYQTPHDVQVIDLVQRHNKPQWPEEPWQKRDLTGMIWNLMEDCWKATPEERPAVQDIIDTMVPLVQRNMRAIGEETRGVVTPTHFRRSISKPPDKIAIAAFDKLCSTVLVLASESGDSSD
ncbi:hypothetical protein DXG01_016854 [Tephrocybe rancida]|nr:hypothetical protein DXG01_016854 [Tephrocybe rancida]